MSPNDTTSAESGDKPSEKEKTSYVVQGKVAHQALGTGFWGIIGTDGEKYRPVEMPEALQKEGLAVEATVEDADAQVSIFMWGKSVRIVEYK